MKNKGLDNLNIIHTGDWHLGHSKIPIGVMCDSIKKYLFPYIEKSDLLVHAGDVFELLLHMTNLELHIVLQFFPELFTKCYEHDTVVRILEGTGSHDRRQMGLWTHTNDIIANKADVRYIKNVTIEYIDKLDIRVAYIPDDVPYKSSDHIVSYIKDLMTMAGWKKLDLVMGHGFFTHTLPPKHKVRIVFDESQFTDILASNGRILFSHVHTQSLCGRVAYSSSFDRLRHGEEEAKGFYYFEKNKPYFIENKDATIFKTLDYSCQNDYDKISEDYLKNLKEIQEDTIAHIRVIHPDIELRRLLKNLTKEYENISYTHEGNKDSKGITRTSDNLNLQSKKGTVITRENLSSLVVQSSNDFNEKHKVERLFQEL